MSEPRDDRVIRVAHDDLYADGVEEWLRREEAVHARPEAVAPEPPGRFAFLLHSVVYNSIAGLLGGLLGWMILEPFFDDEGTGAADTVAGLLFFPIIGMMVGGTVAAAEGIVTRNPSRALRQGAIAMAISFGLCFAGGFVADIVFGISQVFVIRVFGGNPEHPDFTGGTFVGLVIARGLAWSIAGLAVGVSQGLAAKSKKVVANGLVGGLVGGLLGGMSFDPIDRMVMGKDWLSPERTVGADLSRCFGICTVGLLVGFFLGLVENLAKDAWLYMKAGPLRGKQFVLYHDPTVIGSSPKCHVYLFKDPAVEPRHAHIVKHGNRHMVKDLGTPAGVTVNGRKAATHVLATGDEVRIGDTVLEYGQKIRA